MSTNCQFWTTRNSRLKSRYNGSIFLHVSSLPRIYWEMFFTRKRSTLLIWTQCVFSNEDFFAWNHRFEFHFVKMKIQISCFKQSWKAILFLSSMKHVAKRWNKFSSLRHVLPRNENWSLLQSLLKIRFYCLIGISLIYCFTSVGYWWNGYKHYTSKSCQNGWDCIFY